MGFHPGKRQRSVPIVGEFEMFGEPKTRRLLHKQPRSRGLDFVDKTEDLLGTEAHEKLRPQLPLWTHRERCQERCALKLEKMLCDCPQRRRQHPTGKHAGIEGWNGETYEVSHLRGFPEPSAWRCRTWVANMPHLARPRCQTASRRIDVQKIKLSAKA